MSEIQKFMLAFLSSIDMASCDRLMRTRGACVFLYGGTAYKQYAKRAGLENSVPDTDDLDFTIQCSNRSMLIQNFEYANHTFWLPLHHALNKKYPDRFVYGTRDVDMMYGVHILDTRTNTVVLDTYTRLEPRITPVTSIEYIDNIPVLGLSALASKQAELLANLRLLDKGDTTRHLRVNATGETKLNRNILGTKVLKDIHRLAFASSQLPNRQNLRNILKNVGDVRDMSAKMYLERYRHLNTPGSTNSHLLAMQRLVRAANTVSKPKFTGDNIDVVFTHWTKRNPMPDFMVVKNIRLSIYLGGGMAVMLHGAPVHTNDFDFTFGVHDHLSPDQIKEVSIGIRTAMTSYIDYFCKYLKSSYGINASLWFPEPRIVNIGHTNPLDGKMTYSLTQYFLKIDGKRIDLADASLKYLPSKTSTKVNKQLYAATGLPVSNWDVIQKNTSSLLLRSFLNAGARNRNPINGNRKAKGLKNMNRVRYLCGSTNSQMCNNMMNFTNAIRNNANVNARTKNANALARKYFPVTAS
jgi:hypothetical protein